MLKDGNLVAVVGTVTLPEIADYDGRISVAANNFQIKLLEAICPDFFINIAPVFLDTSKCLQVMAGRQINLDSYFIGNFYSERLIKLFLNFIKFGIFVGFRRRRLKIIFYNLDYTNLFLVLLSIILMHKTFIIAADYDKPAKNIYQSLILWVYSRVTGVISLRENRGLNTNNILMTAIISGTSTRPIVNSTNTSVLFSGSLGETTGLMLAIETAIACPHINFIFTGRPFQISEDSLLTLISNAVSAGAKISYHGILPYAEYAKILNESEICLSLRNPRDAEHENNFPSKIAEFMSQAKVVVSTLDYYELPNDTYIKVDYDVSSLSHRLNDLVNNVQLRTMVADKAVEFASVHFTRERARDKIFKLINNV